MNRYIEKNSEFNSNRRIFEAYYNEVARPESRLQKVLETLVSYILMLVHMLSSAQVKALIKVFTVAVSLVGLVGIIGAMEQGSLGLGTGLLIGSLLIALEYLSLRGKAHSSKE